MDGTRFDRLTRAFARVGTRRQVVAGAAVVAVGAGGLEAADAATRCRAGRQTCQRDGQCCSGACRRGRDVPLKDRNRCACGESETPCGNICADLQQDERNCGACGMRCASASTCCDGACVDLSTDEANCGACGVACGVDETCCGGTCADLEVSVSHCGACGVGCRPGEECCEGACIVLEDSGYCGACGVTCDFTQTCVSGVCEEKCLEQPEGESRWCMVTADGSIVWVGGWTWIGWCNADSTCGAGLTCGLQGNKFDALSLDEWPSPGFCFVTS